MPADQLAILLVTHQLRAASAVDHLQGQITDDIGPLGQRVGFAIGAGLQGLFLQIGNQAAAIGTLPTGMGEIAVGNEMLHAVFLHRLHGSGQTSHGPAVGPFQFIDPQIENLLFFLLLSLGHHRSNGITHLVEIGRQRQGMSTYQTARPLGRQPLGQVMGFLLVGTEQHQPFPSGPIRELGDSDGGLVQVTVIVFLQPLLVVVITITVPIA